MGRVCWKEGWLVKLVEGLYFHLDTFVSQDMSWLPRCIQHLSPGLRLVRLKTQCRLAMGWLTLIYPGIFLASFCSFRRERLAKDDRTLTSKAWSLMAWWIECGISNNLVGVKGIDERRFGHDCFREKQKGDVKEWPRSRSTGRELSECGLAIVECEASESEVTSWRISSRIHPSILLEESFCRRFAARRYGVLFTSCWESHVQEFWH